MKKSNVSEENKKVILTGILSENSGKYEIIKKKYPALNDGQLCSVLLELNFAIDEVSLILDLSENYIHSVRSAVALWDNIRK